SVCARSKSCRPSGKSPPPCSSSPRPSSKSAKPSPLLSSRTSRTGRPAPTAERIQKLLSAAGLGSRREIEGWSAAGRVRVNAAVASLGARAGPSDAIEVDGKPVRPPQAEAPRVLLYHKPVGELVTRSDPQGRRTVFAALPPGRWVAVGRLDLNS